jgi:hypothetical protein
MKTNILKYILLISVMAPIAFTTSCALNTARTNARIEKGFHIGGDGGVITTVGGVDINGTKTSNQQKPIAELDLGYSHAEENKFGFDIQAKLGFLVLPAMDLYLEAPHVGNFYYGVGTELGLANAVYLTGTYYMTRKFFVTLTGRTSYDFLEVANRSWIFNPQLALGLSDSGALQELSLFCGYTYFPGRGQDLSFDIGGDFPDEIAHHFIYGGIAVKF